MKVYHAINEVSNALLSGIGKEKRNQQQGFSFRGIDDVYNALAPALVAHGLVILPRILERSVTERQTKNGGALFYVVVKAEFDFVCTEDGSKHTVATFGEAMDSGDKATNKAMSIAYKYAAFQTFCIPTEDTSQDPDSETHEFVSKVNKQTSNSKITPDQIQLLESAILHKGYDVRGACDVFKVRSLSEIKAADFNSFSGAVDSWPPAQRWASNV